MRSLALFLCQELEKLGIHIACENSLQDAFRGHCHCLPGAGQRRRMSPPLDHPEVKQMDFSLSGAGETFPSCFIFTFIIIHQSALRDSAWRECENTLLLLLGIRRCLLDRILPRKHRIEVVLDADHVLLCSLARPAR